VWSKQDFGVGQNKIFGVEHDLQVSMINMKIALKKNKTRMHVLGNTLGRGRT
jgi:hypothetical protein